MAQRTMNNSVASSPGPVRVSSAVRVAVLDLQSQSLPRAEVSTISQRLRAHFVNRSGFEVVERNNLSDVVTEQSFQLSGGASIRQAVQMGQLLGAERIIVGNVERFRGLTTTTIREINVETGVVNRVAFDDCIECELQDVLQTSTERVASAFCVENRSLSSTTYGSHASARALTVNPVHLTTQAALNALGYSAGTADGVWGTRSSEALVRFQSANGLATTGTVNSEVLDALSRKLPTTTSVSRQSSTAIPGPWLADNLSNRATSARVAENGSHYGEISPATGRPKTVEVRGYYRRDGTYVRGHYRSAPRRR